MTAIRTSLLARVASGESSAMAECLDRYGGLVWSLARRHLSSHTDAEDAVQEIFIELWRVADRYEPSTASEPAFIATVARRRLIDRRRRQDRRVVAGPLADLDPAEPSAAAPEWLQICEEASLARRALGELSSDQQEVLTLALEKGCSQTEIADRLALPLGTVKTHARRGLIRLRELLSDRRIEAPITGGAR